MISLSPRLFFGDRRNLLSIYLTAGYPSLGDTLPLCEELERSCVDLIEIGFPFSDPLADGPVIQASSESAIRNGMNLSVLFKQLAELRRNVTIPVILMGYLNPALQFGFERFCAECKSAGVDGLILPDLPLPEYIAQYREIIHGHGLHLIFLVDQNTTAERLQLIDHHSTSFIYAVSAPAVTGGALVLDDARKRYLERLRGAALEHPFLIGFGITDREAFTASCEFAAGAIIGSAFIRALQNQDDAAGAAREFVRRLRS